ncbi:MAG: D-2-hydroxyacid dehydrogenase [Alphaproteobacteria bacterium]
MTSGRLRLAVLIRPTQDAAFAMTPKRFAAAARRHPDVAAQLDPVFVADDAGLDAELGAAEALLGYRFATADMARRAPRLRWIQLSGAGAEHLAPFDWLPKGLALTTASGVHTAKAGEFVTMALLMLNARVPAMATNQRRHAWRQIFTPSIVGRTVLIVGLGAMGAAAAHAAQRLGLRVSGVRRGARPARFVDRVVGTDGLDAELPDADFVVLALPVTAATRGLMDRRRIALMKPGAGLVNVGRAALLDYAALRDALGSQALSGAILDVFDPEPLPAGSPLWDAPNLTVVPHCSSDDRESYADRVLDLTFANAGRLLAGRPLRNRLSPRREY